MGPPEGHRRPSEERPSQQRNLPRRQQHSHFLSQIPYQALSRDKIDLGKRNLKGKYDDVSSISENSFISETY